MNMVVDEAAFKAQISGNKNYVGNWATFREVPSQAFVRNELAFIPSLKSDVSYVAELKIIQPINEQLGIVGSQSGAAGGASQINFIYPQRQGWQYFAVIGARRLL